MAIGMKMEGLECHVFIGGTPLQLDKARLKKCHIAVGSPGRIKQLIELGYMNTASIRLFILDEADKLLEEGSFQEQINWIYSSLPPNKQMLAVSATYPESMASALARYMREPTFVRLNASDPGLIGLKQYYKVVNSYPLPHKIFDEKVQHLQELFSKIPFNQALVFSNLHSRAQHLADILTSKGFPAVCISGSMSQDHRLDAMAKLKQFHCRVLISTDLTSRGIDAEKVNLVINLDVPQDWETYMHRIGRAGRYGTYGLAVTYCCRGEEENMMMLIAQKCNLQLLCLPEPITADLMEDSPKWNVEVTPLKRANPLPKTDILPAEAMTVTSTRMDPQSALESPTCLISKSLKSNFKKGPKQKHMLKATTEESILNPVMKGTIEELPTKSAADVPVVPSLRKSLSLDAGKGRLLKNSPEAAGEQESSDHSRPKILSLASFKHKSDLTLTFTELVEDYEQFIKEGLDKHVEIIRVYTGPGEHGYPQQSEDPNTEMIDDYEKERNGHPNLEKDNGSETERTDDPETEMNDDSEWPGRSGSIANSSVRATYGSKSENESFSSSSSSDYECREQHLKNEPQNKEAHETEKPPNDFPEDEKEFLSSSSTDHVQPNSAPVAHVEHFSRDLQGLSENRPITKSKVSRQKPVKAKSKWSKSSQAKHPPNHSQRGIHKHREEEVSATLEPRNPGFLPYERQAYEDYWRSYYQAWQDYYSAASNPYYRNFSKRSSWMAAYHMHSVYLQELLKP
ncbi:putative ATP-dependent RNA helicase DDX20 isoform X2 [Lissotriton helveticus]